MTALSISAHSGMSLNQACSSHQFIRNFYAGCSIQKGLEQ